MVLEKRSHIALLPLPPSIGPETEGWHVENTGEFFTEYDKFLDRVDYLKKVSHPIPLDR